MKINTRSWHYRLWAFTYLDEPTPDRIGRCAYVRRMIWRTVPTALVYALAFLGFNIGFVLVSIWYPFLGSGYPRYYRSWIRGSKSSPIKRTNGLPLGRLRLHPYRLVLPLLATWGVVWGFQTYPIQTAWAIGTFLSVAILLGIGWLIGKARNTDTYRLLSGYLRDKKEKVCPMIEFEYTPSPSDLAAFNRSLRDVRADGSTDYADDRAAIGEGLDDGSEPAAVRALRESGGDADGRGSEDRSVI